MPSGNSSLLYPRQAVKIVDLVPSVPKVATNVNPRLFFVSSDKEESNVSPRSFLILFRIAGLLDGAKSTSMSFYGLYFSQ